MNEWLTFKTPDGEKTISLSVEYAPKSAWYGWRFSHQAMSVRDAKRLVDCLNTQLEWSRHPLYQWGQKKIGAI